MEEIIKSPLKMKNGAEVRTLDELKENFDLESVLSYYLNGQLVTWLRNYYYDNIADKVEALDSASDDIPRQLCNIIGVEYVEVGITIDDIKEKLEHRKMLQELLPEEELQFVATNYDELKKLIRIGDFAIAIDALKGLYILALDLRLMDLYWLLVDIYEALVEEDYVGIDDKLEDILVERQRLMEVFHV